MIFTAIGQRIARALYDLFLPIVIDGVPEKPEPLGPGFYLVSLSLPVNFTWLAGRIALGLAVLRQSLARAGKLLPSGWTIDQGQTLFAFEVTPE
ncbi:MAG TPA: hypothetical protein VGJ40_01610 [Gaiellaceae bacterium]|jgi:hypothetical protein